MLKLRSTVPFSLRKKTPAPIRDLVEGCLRLPYRVTSKFRSLPQFIIFGAQKSGTTSLQNYLVQHPDILWSLKKEVHYFDRNFEKSEYFYRSYFPFNYKIERGFICGEASPDYMFNPYLAERIYRLIPDIHLIAVLRNPTERAISQYFHEIRWGNEHLPILAAFQAEEERIIAELSCITADRWSHSQVLRSFSYKRRGQYIDQLETFDRFFDNEQMLIISSESLFSETHKTMDKIFGFLGVDQAFVIKDISARNVGSNKRYVPPEVYNYLDEHFYPYNQKLYNYLGQDLSW